MEHFPIDVLQTQSLGDYLSDVRAAGTHLPRNCDGRFDHFKE
jgi:hypothetical protein